MIIVDSIIQGSPEWIQLRLGIPTSSEFSRIITSSGEPSKSAKGYLNEKIDEIFLGYPKKQYISDDMRRGSLNEPIARSLFEFMYGVQVRQVAFCYFDEKKRWGASPDGLIEEWNKGLEIKDAKPSLQYNRLKNGWNWKTDHYHQVQGCLLATGYKAWYLMSHCVGLEPIIIKVERDNNFCAKLMVELNGFCDKLDEVEQAIRGRM